MYICYNVRDIKFFLGVTFLARPVESQRPTRIPNSATERTSVESDFLIFLTRKLIEKVKNTYHAKITA